MEPVENLIKRHEKFGVDPKVIIDLNKIQRTSHSYHEILMTQLRVAKPISELLLAKLGLEERIILRQELCSLVHESLNFGCYGPNFCHDKYLSDSLVEAIKKRRYTIEDFTKIINQKWSTLAEIQPKQDPRGRISNDGPIFRLFVPNKPYKRAA